MCILCKDRKSVGVHLERILATGENNVDDHGPSKGSHDNSIYLWKKTDPLIIPERNVLLLPVRFWAITRGPMTSKEVEMKKISIYLEAQILLDKQQLKGHETQLEHIRASCCHIPIAWDNGATRCDVCGAQLEGCLIAPNGCCMFDELNECCIHCGIERHAVTKPLS